MDLERFNADQFRRQLMNYTDAELIKLGRSCSSAASRWLDPMTQQLEASKYELCRQEWRRRHPRGSQTDAGRIATPRDRAHHGATMIAIGSLFSL
jgi:hypothetical protein